MKIKHHNKVTTENMMVYYETLEEKAEHHKQMILDGWMIDMEKSKNGINFFWVRHDSETFVKFKVE